MADSKQAFFYPLGLTKMLFIKQRFFSYGVAYCCANLNLLLFLLIENSSF